MDTSNLWIAGQAASAKKLVDADTDPRFRVDLGKFLQLITKERHIAKAFLYGSVPPSSNDSVWKAARKHNCELHIFDSEGVQEKEVDVAMTTDILENLYKQMNTETKENTVFIAVTGNRDLKTPIEKVLDNGVPVELWFWEHYMARDFGKLANTHKLFTASTLDSVQDSFSPDVDPAHTIVYRDIPGGKQFVYTLADHISRLMRLFYISSIENEFTQDLIVQFPNSTPNVLKTLDKLEFGYKPCSYLKYLKSRNNQEFVLQLTNRFEALSGIDADNFESAQEAVEVSMKSKFREASTREEESAVDFDDWETEVHRKVGEMTRRKEITCRWGDHCAVGFECPYKHTEYETELFAKFPMFRFKFLKTRECNKKEQHTTEELRKWCPFAHKNEDSWCLTCRMYGHLTDDCLLKK